MKLKHCILCGGKLINNGSKGVSCLKNLVELFISPKYVRIDFNDKYSVLIYTDGFVINHNDETLAELPFFDFDIHNMPAFQAKIDKYLSFL